MKLHDKLAAALLVAVLVAGCGGAQPEAGDAKVSAPTAPAAAPKTATPEPAAGVTAPATTAPTAPTVTAPTNPTTTTPAPTAPATAPEPVQALSFTTLQKGTHSGITEKKATLLTDEAGWQTNWQRLSAHQVPAPPAPAMDFSQQSVLAVYMGEQRSGGYAIEITGVELVNGTLKVTVKETRPAPGAMVTMALTQPYHMVRIPKVPAGTKVEVNW